MTRDAAPGLLVPYVPRTVLGWDSDGPHHRVVDGSLVSADISGFTALSERLAKYGREGAEELTVLLNRCFGGMIGIVDTYGGDVLKFGGDALLILFTGPDHTRRAAAACYQMRALIERRWSTPLVSKVELGISQGIHSGEFNLHLVHAGYHELWVVGPGMTATVTCEGDAERGQILLSHEAAATLEPDLLGPAQEAGRPLLGEVVAEPMPSSAADARDVTAYVPPWLVDQAEAGPITEHRAVTVGFVFFGGVDDLMADEGPAAVHEALQRLATATREAADRFGVYWLASDVYPRGGKIILTAGAPRSTGQDEDAAVRALRAILDAGIPLPIRAGVNRGHVFMGDLGSPARRTFTVMGDAVNLAARLMQKSQTGQMVASQAVLDVVPSRVVTTPLEPFLVKGKSEPIHASLVQSVADVATEVAPASDQQVPLVGREREMARLSDLMDRARAGRGVLVDLIGEPGIGKTRLVRELLDANPDLDILKATGGRYSRRSPYFAVRQMLRRLAGTDLNASSAQAGEALREWVGTAAPSLLEWLPLLAVPFDATVPMTPTVERIGAENRAQKVREVVGDLLQAVLDGPSVIVVDDAQWLDEASDELFGNLGIRARERPWLMIASHRVDTTCFATADRRAERITLGELTADDMRELTVAAVGAGLGSSPEEIDDLVARGATNPLFILELVRAGTAIGEQTPDSIEALVTARIDTLNATDRLRLREGAVLGSVIDTDLLAEATEDDQLAHPAAWSSLSSFVQRDSDGALRFQHSLYREVAYEGLSFRRRQALHAAVGHVLESRWGDNWREASELLSLHFHAARDWRRSWRYSVTAGDRARGKYANAEAAEFYQRALSARRPSWTTRPEVSTVAESLGDVLELNGRFEEAERAVRTARRFHEDPEADVRLLRKAGVLHERQGHYPQALRWYSRGMRKARTALDDARGAKEEGQLCIAYAGVRFRQGDTEGCLTWAHRAENIAQRIDDRAMLAHASYLLMIGYGVLRRPEVAHYRDISLPLFEAEGDLVGQANVLNNLGVDAKEEGRWADALDLYERSRRARELAGDVIGAATAANNIGEILLDQGHLEHAEALFGEALLSWWRAKYPVGVAMATCYLGRLEARRGNIAEARRLFAEALERYEQINASYFIVGAEDLPARSRGDGGQPQPHRGTRRNAGADPPGSVTRCSRPCLPASGRGSPAYRAATGSHRPCPPRRSSFADSIGYPYEAAFALRVRGTTKAGLHQDPQADRDRARILFEALGVVELPASLT